MKNITKALLGLGLLAGAAAPAFAADAYTPDAPITASGFYIRGDAGWSWLNTDDDDDSVGVIGGGVGYQFNDNLRTDLRADWAGIGNDDTSFTTVLGNVYFDIPTQTIITPYLGAGVGYGWAEITATTRRRRCLRPDGRRRGEPHRQSERRCGLPLPPDPVGRHL